MKRKHIITLVVCIVAVAVFGVAAFFITTASREQSVGLRSVDGAYYYYDETGARATGWQTIDGRLYYFDPVTGEAIKGWFTDADGSIYYFGEEGYALTGQQSIGGKVYTFDDEGRLQTDVQTDHFIWQSKDGKYYCVDSSGNYVTGLIEINGALYYFDNDGVRQSGWHTLEGKLYYFSELDGRAPKGWYTVDGSTYYFGEEGYALTGEQTIGGKKYVFGDDGKLQQRPAQSTGQGGAQRPSQSATVENVPASAQPNAPQYNWAEVDGETYYQTADGTRAKGLQQIGGELYYLDPTTGARQTGWHIVNGNLYHFDATTGAAEKGWYTTNEPHMAASARAARAASAEYTYYFGENGAAIKGIITLNNKFYYFSDSFVQQTGWQTVNGNLYNFGQNDGAAVTGWTDLPNNGGRCYLLPDKGYAATGLVAIGSDTYYFTSSGVMQIGWFTIDGGKYCFDAEGKAMKNTFADQNGTTYYLGGDGAAVTGQQTIDGQYYYFGEGGARQIGWQSIGGKHYYYDPATGQAVRNNWMQNGSAKMYLGDDGAAVTGLATISGALYYFDANSVMQTGWQTANNQRYYFDANGAAVSGWQQLGGQKYYFGAEGYALTDIQKIGQAYYFFDASGAMQTGWQKAASGKLYYLQANKEGAALTGWYSEGNDRYYFHDAEAYALTGQHKIGDVTYTFNEAGQVVDETRENYTWYTDESGNKYYTDGNGKFVKGLATIEGKLYYFNDKGVMQTGRRTLEEKFYIFGADGAAVTGWHTDEATGETFYFDKQRSYATTGLALVDGEHYYFSAAKETLGVMLTDGWLNLEGQDYYFQQDGKTPKGFYGHANGNTYLFCDEGYILRGLQQYGSNYYYLDASGVRQSSWQTIGDDLYCFGGTDNAAIIGWHTDSEGTYYFAPHGAAVNGLQTLGAQNQKYYFEEMRLQTGWKVLDGNRYYFDAQNGGAAKVGWFTDADERTYYFGADGVAVVGICTIDGKEYQFDADGVLVETQSPTTNTWVEEDGKVYYRDANGNNTVGLATIDGALYYFDKDGVRQSGWHTVEGEKYYFASADGRGVTGWQTIDGETYYFGTAGFALTGEQTIDGKEYEFDDDGRLVSEEAPPETSKWVEEDGKRYYIDSNGKRATGLVTIEGALYYFDADGVMQTGRHTVDGAHYYFNGEGVAQVGWQLVEGRWYRYDAATAKQLLSWQYRPLDEGGTATHYYDADGASPTGWTVLNEIERYFFADGHMAQGWEEIDGQTYYFRQNGMKATGAVYIDGVIHFFDENGQLASGWQTDDDGNRYYFGAEGAYKGWQQVESRWYLFDESNGVQQTGWRYRTLAEGGTHTYYYDPATGALPAEGFGEVGGVYRYFYADGHMAIGWQEINGATYHFDTDGKMATGVVTIDGVSHFFDGEGRLKTGWQTDADGNRYYFGAEGAYKGWQQVEERWYLFDETTGAQKIGWQSRNEGNAVLTYYYSADGSLPAAGWGTVDGQNRYVMPDGQMAQGWLTLEAGRYYFKADGTPVTDWQLLENRRYVFDANGVQQTGWQSRVATMGEVWYFYNADGTLPEAGWQTVENQRRYVLTDGQMAQGWWPIDGYSYHFNADGTYKTGTHVIDGETCIFTAEGYYITPPTITSVGMAAGTGNNKTLTVNAAASTLLSDKTLQYSFDGGNSWQAGASREFAPGVTLAAGSIQVKDSIGNVVKYNSPISIPAFSGRENGIDVSVHQGLINWKSVADSGVEFAIIRSLCWNRSTNSYGIDPYFEYNVRNAKANGIKVGTYLYSYAFSVAEMAQEISYFVKSTEVQRLLSEGVLFDLPVFIDYEDPLITKNTTHLTIGQRTDIVRQGMVMIEQMSGYKFLPGFYTYYNFAKTAIDGAQLQREGYDFWVARYGTAAHGWSPSPAIWQYSSTGRVPGISTNVDLNYNYTDYSGINGGNVPPPVTSHNLTVTNQYGQVVTGQAASILAQIVENEVGGFNNAEVYKAQAVAAHSWIMYQQSQGYQAPQVGLKSPRAAVQTAVNQVVTEILVYDGAAAFAPYYAYSNGTTNNSQYWGSNLPYLQSVTSSWDREKPAYAGRISRGDLKGRIEAVYGAGATNGYAEADWIKITGVNAAGYVTSVSVCGYKPTVDFFYQTLIRYDNGNGGLTYPIGSPSFTISYNGSGMWNFTTSGYGHGVGMSQYGASRMAAGGSTYKQILAHYYPGTTVSSI